MTRVEAVTQKRYTSHEKKIIANILLRFCLRSVLFVHLLLGGVYRSCKKKKKQKSSQVDCLEYFQRAVESSIKKHKFDLKCQN